MMSRVVFFSRALLPRPSSSFPFFFLYSGDVLSAALLTPTIHLLSHESSYFIQIGRYSSKYGDCL
jgi:hypothetical protein